MSGDENPGNPDQTEGILYLFYLAAREAHEAERLRRLIIKRNRKVDPSDEARDEALRIEKDVLGKSWGTIYSDHAEDEPETLRSRVRRARNRYDSNVPLATLGVGAISLAAFSASGFGRGQHFLANSSPLVRLV